MQQVAASAPDAEVIDASQQSIPEDIMAADIFCGHAKERPVPWDRVAAQGRLQWIQSSAAGMDHCLTPETVQSPIQITSASGLFADQVAEQTLALLLGLLRSLPVFFRAARRRSLCDVPQPTCTTPPWASSGLAGTDDDWPNFWPPSELACWPPTISPSIGPITCNSCCPPMVCTKCSANRISSFVCPSE